MLNFKIIIAGCRDFNDYEKLNRYCEACIRDLHANITIVSGHASGADTLGERFAKEHDLPIELHPADWNRFGKAAGPKRNAEMAESADALIAFWDGKSRGTKNMIENMRQRGKQIRICKI